MSAGAVADPAQYAAEVLGGACGAVAGTLMPGAVVLPSESAAATGLPEHTVRCLLEVLVKYHFARRDGPGYTGSRLPDRLTALYSELRLQHFG